MRGAMNLITILTPPTLALAQRCQNGQACSSEEYCSADERCERCFDICDTSSHNRHEYECNRYCPEYSKSEGVAADIRAIQQQQKLILILVIILLILVIFSNGIRFVRWFRKKRSIKSFFKNLSSKKDKNLKEQTPGTIPNVMHMTDTDRPLSQIYSVTGVEGSTVLTVTTPVSTRYPAEDSTTTTEYSYDNAGLQVTPSSNKPPFPQNSY